jgi:hypothetical protein
MPFFVAAPNVCCEVDNAFMLWKQPIRALIQINLAAGSRCFSMKYANFSMICADMPHLYDGSIGRIGPVRNPHERRTNPKSRLFVVAVEAKGAICVADTQEFAENYLMGIVAAGALDPVARASGARRGKQRKFADPAANRRPECRIVALVVGDRNRMAARKAAGAGR